MKKTRPLWPLPSTSREILYETPKQGYDDDDVTEEEEEGNVGTVASPRRFPDTQYGIRRDSEQLMIGYFPVFIETNDNVTIKGTVFTGSEGPVGNAGA